MSASASATECDFYPAYCFKASPTWFTWVKLTAHDVHFRLGAYPEYHGNLFFHNHPIRFVQLIGVVVNVENYFEKYWLFTIDDSSGATIDITCRKPVVPAAKQDPDEVARVEAMSHLDNGVVVQLRGQISMFRHVRQIQLERITIIPDTNQEMRLIAARTTFFRNVLSNPWMLSEMAQKRLLKEATDEKEASQSNLVKRQKREQDRKDRENRYERRILSQYQRDETKRTAAAEDARLAGSKIKRD